MVAMWKQRGRPSLTPPRQRNQLTQEQLNQAACLGYDWHIFFPDPGESTDQAKQICNGVKGDRLHSDIPPCPIVNECLHYAYTHREYGVWGGTDEDDREKMRRKANRQRRAA